MTQTEREALLILLGIKAEELRNGGGGADKLMVETGMQAHEAAQCIEEIADLIGEEAEANGPSLQDALIEARKRLDDYESGKVCQLPQSDEHAQMMYKLSAARLGFMEIDGFDL